MTDSVIFLTYYAIYGKFQVLFCWFCTKTFVLFIQLYKSLHMNYDLLGFSIVLILCLLVSQPGRMGTNRDPCLFHCFRKDLHGIQRDGFLMKGIH